MRVSRSSSAGMVTEASVRPASAAAQGFSSASDEPPGWLSPTLTIR